jgi:thiamine-monophosphate kinase
MAVPLPRHPASLGEFDLIERVRRFADHPGALGLADDAALLDGFVITHDSIAESVHFLSTDPPASVGWKLVAVNLSDLAAKGATPVAALLSLTIAGDGEWEESFLGGIEAACESYGLALIGGDTIALPHDAPRVLGMTAIGRAGEAVPRRAGGKSGDKLWLVGNLGDSAAGLSQLIEDPRAVGPLVDIYRRPIPLLALGKLLAPHANAMMDVSDGLLIDAGRLARASGCAVRIDLDAISLSEPFRELRGDDLRARIFAATGGDDYALLAALPPGLDAALILSSLSPPSLACVGSLHAGQGISLVGDGGRAIELPEHLGHEHRGTSGSPMADRA